MDSRNDTNAGDDVENTTEEDRASQTKRKIKEQAAGDREDERLRKKETRAPSATPRKRKIKEQASGDGEDEQYKKKETRGASATPRKRRIKEKVAGDDVRNCLSLPQMVVESIKSLKKRNGASFEAIRQHMADHYRVDENAVTPNLKRFLKAGVQRGILENTSKDGADGRFKVKTTEGIRGYKAKKV